MAVRTWLAHPLTRGLDINHPLTTQLRRRIVAEKGFLRKIYEDWYGAVAASVPPGEGRVVEVGSGAGFLGEFIPNLVTTEVFHCAGVRLVMDGTRMPFRDGSLRAVVMTDVLHHIPNVRAFFSEADRCVRAGGVVSMIEPWVTPWSRLIYTRLHHEPLSPEAREWEFPSSGPLSGANGALPWILFERDRAQFEREFPGWRIKTVRPMMPFRYLVSGGVSTRNMMPAWSTPLWRFVERLFEPWMGGWAMFAHVVLVKEPAPTPAGADPGGPPPAPRA